MKRFSPAALARLGVLLSLAAAAALPPAPGAELVYRHCTGCHAITTVIAARGLDRPGWSAVLDRMEGYGLALPIGERTRLLDYLIARIGSRSSSPAAPAADAGGETLYREHCAACHENPNRAPPLVGRPEWGEHPEYLAQVVVFGVSGPLPGTSYAGAMEPLPYLDDATVARIVGYLAGVPFTVEDVARERTRGWTPSLVRLFRPLP
ncbi:c-type cytochrome [Deinococcota bacterium DY0809b]